MFGSPLPLLCEREIRYSQLIYIFTHADPCLFDTSSFRLDDCQWPLLSEYTARTPRMESEPWIVTLQFGRDLGYIVYHETKPSPSKQILRPIPTWTPQNPSYFTISHLARLLLATRPTHGKRGKPNDSSVTRPYVD